MRKTLIQREVFGVRERERESGLIEAEIKTESTRKQKMSRAGKIKNVLMCFCEEKMRRKWKDFLIKFCSEFSS